ncbi:MAG: hypothetical protein ACYC48_02145 [Minisyncoccota bacterium]
MTQIMIAPDTKTITDGQIENTVSKLRDALRKHRSEFAAEAAQTVLGVENLGMELLAPFRARIEAVSSIIIRRVRVDRTRTPQEVIDATGRRQYVDSDVLATMPKGEGEEVDVHFVPTKRFVLVVEVPAFLAQYGLVPDPRAQAAVNEADPAFADKYPNGTQWGDNCCLAFDRWFGERSADCFRDGSDWSVHWFLSGVPAPRK